MNRLARPAIPPPRKRGLTLLEVLLALAIFVSSIAVISQLLAQGVRGALLAQIETEAVFRAESKLAELVAGATPLQSGQNVVYADNPAWNWSATVQPGPTEQLLYVEVTVAHSGSTAHGETTFSVSRLMRDPQLLQEAAMADAEAAAAQESEAQSP